jgi:hypothetical protein
VQRLHGKMVTQFTVGLYLLSYDCLDGDSNVLIIVNVKYNYLSIESSCLGWQVCEIKLLTVAN